MEILGDAPPQLSPEELIRRLSKPIQTVMSSEMADEADVDRVWHLRKVHKADLYYRDLAYFAPSLYAGLVDATGIDGSLIPNDANSGVYDYTQNIYRGFCTKLVAVLGTRIPNVTAVPNDPTNEKDQAAARAANDAALYIRQHCDLQVQIIWMVFSLFNFGTSFWSIEWVVDGDKNGWKLVDQDTTEQQMLGEGDPDMDAFPVDVPSKGVPQRIAKGALEIDIKDASEVSVPLDTDGRRGVAACQWLREEQEVHKSELLAEFGDFLRDAIKSGENTIDDQTASQQYGESVRSAMASPIGLVRPKRENRWTRIREDWAPRMYEMVDDKESRQLLKDNYPDGIRITIAKGILVKLEARKLVDHWQECQPAPGKRIMIDPIGQDWIVAQDICNNLLNQMEETVDRSNDPGFADPTRVDTDAWERRRDSPGQLIPAVRPAGGTLADLIYRPPPVQFSDQIPPFRDKVEQTAMEISGELPEIWGGAGDEPTARQTELKTNAAIRQLSVIWVLIGKSLEKVNEKACRLLAENEDGVLSFSKRNQFGKFDSVAVVMEDLKSGEYHFEADEAIPMTWGQQRDLLMWMLDKPAEILKAWGLDDPLNIYEFKELLGMPGMRVPHLDDRDKGLDVISKLLQEQAQPPQPGPDGSPGKKQASIAPDWEDDSVFMAKLAKAWLTNNFELKDQNPGGYENVQLWGQAHEQIANQPAPAPPPKTSVSFAVKGPDVGDPATAAALAKSGILPPGTQTQQQPMPKTIAPPPNGAPPLPMGPPGV